MNALMGDQGVIDLIEANTAVRQAAARALELDPLNVSGHTWLGIVLWCAGRFDEAIATGSMPSSWTARRGTRTVNVLY